LKRDDKTGPFTLLKKRITLTQHQEGGPIWKRGNEGLLKLSGT